MARHTEIQQTRATMEEMARSRCIREAAIMLVLVRTGTEFEHEVVEGVWNNVAAVAAEYYASPDDIQIILEKHEPSLALEQIHNGK